MEFGWDEAKNKINQQKHGLSFETAARAFADPLALLICERFEYGEERWQLFGAIDGCLLVCVIHTIFQTEDTEIVRIISARKASKQERYRYENENR